MKAAGERKNAEKATAVPGLSLHPRPQQACNQSEAGGGAVPTATRPWAAEEGVSSQARPPAEILQQDMVGVWGTPIMQPAFSFSIEEILRDPHPSSRVSVLNADITCKQVSVQKEICIESCLAPLLSDLLLASLDRHLEAELSGSKVLRVFLYIDDLFLSVTMGCDLTPQVTAVSAVFSRVLDDFTLTTEILKNGE
ncbi:hypothetical protein MRX96_000469 [Rhipicephalus microplus]